jgi:hypothetical protein
VNRANYRTVVSPFGKGGLRGIFRLWFDKLTTND